jgi:hypothetical protein
MGAGMLTWALVPSAICGQILFKVLMQFVGCLWIKKIKK